MEQKIKQILSDHLGVPIEDLKDQADLKKDLNAENLEIADALTRLEQEFSISLSEDETRNLKTVGDIIHCFK